MFIGLDMASGRDKTSYLTITPGMIAKAWRERQEKLQREHERRIVLKYQDFEDNYYIVRNLFRMTSKVDRSQNKQTGD